MKKPIIIVLCLFALLAGFLAGSMLKNDQSEASASCEANPMAERNDLKEITALLRAQDAMWNSGDIDGFMSYYWPSEELRFASGGKVTYGWKGTLDGYKIRYPDKAAMGMLKFEDLIVDVIEPCDALVFGRWRLVRESDEPNGLFTLHMKKLDGQWKIVSDHTSSAD